MTPIFERAGIPPTLVFHDLRHIAASYALGLNMPVTSVAQMLGHSSPAVTMSVYAHAMPNAQREIAEAMDALIAGTRLA